MLEVYIKDAMRLMQMRQDMLNMASVYAWAEGKDREKLDALWYEKPEEESSEPITQERYMDQLAEFGIKYVEVPAPQD